MLDWILPQAGTLKFFSNPDFVEVLPGHTQTGRFFVHLPDHPNWKIHINPL